MDEGGGCLATPLRMKRGGGGLEHSLPPPSLRFQSSFGTLVPGGGALSEEARQRGDDV